MGFYIQWYHACMLRLLGIFKVLWFVYLSVCFRQMKEGKRGGVICLSGTSKGKGEGKGRRGCIFSFFWYWKYTCAQSEGSSAFIHLHLSYNRTPTSPSPSPSHTTPPSPIPHPPIYVAPAIPASPFVPPLTSTFFSCSSPFASGFAAWLALKLCSKSAMISSMCSVPTEMRMRSSVTPESMRSDSESCSWVVVQGWMARVLESPTLRGEG